MNSRRQYFVFDGVNSMDLGLYISAGMTFNDAEDDYESVSIPGRSGDILIKNNRLKNRAGGYPAFVYAEDPVKLSQKLSQIRNTLGSRSGYKRLQDSYNPDVYMMAAFAGGIQFEPNSRVRVAEMEIQFDCKPQRFLLSGEMETVLAASGSIYNPTLFESKPLLVVTGYGTLGIGSYSVEITGTASLVTYIDCNVMECYTISGGVKTSRNGYVSTGTYFPVLSPGRNNISLGTGISSLTIIPRWWQK